MCQTAACYEVSEVQWHHRVLVGQIKKQKNKNGRTMGQISKSLSVGSLICPGTTVLESDCFVISFFFLHIPTDFFAGFFSPQKSSVQKMCNWAAKLLFISSSVHFILSL